MNESEDITSCLILISKLELWLVTEENANMSQMFSATSVGILLHPSFSPEAEIIFKMQGCVIIV